VIFPLSLAKTISGLRYISILSVGSMIYLLLVLLVRMPSYIEYYSTNPRLSVNYFTFNMEFFQSVGVIFFAYTNQS